MLKGQLLMAWGFGARLLGSPLACTIDYMDPRSKLSLSFQMYNMRALPGPAHRVLMKGQEIGLDHCLAHIT